MIAALLCSIVGFTFIELLCQPFEVFGWWPPLLRRLLFGTDSVVDYEDMTWWQLLAYKPLAACGKCCAGWLAVAYCLISNIQSPVFFVAVAIFGAWSLEKLKEKIEQ